MRFEIEPKIGLGNFILGMNINQVLTLIKRNGYYYKHCKLISNKEKNTPIFLEIPSELITLRFNYYTQNLELIEKRIIINNDINDNNLLEANADSEYYYKNKLFYMQNKNKEFHIIKYQNIAQLFGLSKVPKKLNKNKNIFLEYSGIGFYFTNVTDLEKSEDLDISSDPSSVDTNSVLSKFFIFKEDSLYDSLNTRNIFETNDILIKYNTSKGKSIKIKRNNDNSKCIISIGDDIEDVLRELKNPNYIYYANDINENYNQIQDTGSVLYNQTSNKMFYLNYFKYGFDIMICNNKVNRIILHTNQIGDSKFGVYERCNFKLKLGKDYLSTLMINNKIEENKEETNKEINERRKNSSRKNSGNENIKNKDKINIKEKEEKSNSKEENLNNRKIKENKEFQERKDNNNKDKEETGLKKQSNLKNINIKSESVKEDNNDIKKEQQINKVKNDESLEEKNENEKNIKEENINNIKENKETEKKEMKEKEMKEKEEKEKEEKEKREKEEKEKEEKEKKEKERKEKEEKEKEEKEKKEREEEEREKEEREKEEKEKKEREKEEKEKEEREKEEKKKKEREEREMKEKEEEEKKKEEEKKNEEKIEGEKKEEENKQLQNNNYTSSKNNRRRRKKHGNPPKKKNELTKEENDESDNEEENNNIKEKETKNKVSNDNNIDKEYFEIFPWTDFKQEFLSKIDYNKNLRHQKWDEGTSKIINCYFFNGLLFEVVDKNVIGTVIIY